MTPNRRLTDAKLALTVTLQAFSHLCYGTFTIVFFGEGHS